MFLVLFIFVDISLIFFHFLIIFFVYRFVLPVLTCTFEQAWMLLRVWRHNLIYRKFSRT